MWRQTVTCLATAKVLFEPLRRAMCYAKQQERGDVQEKWPAWGRTPAQTHDFGSPNTWHHIWAGWNTQPGSPPRRERAQQTTANPQRLQPINTFREEQRSHHHLRRITRFISKQRREDHLLRTVAYYSIFKLKRYSVASKNVPGLNWWFHCKCVVAKDKN